MGSRVASVVAVVSVLSTLAVGVTVGSSARSASATSIDTVLPNGFRAIAVDGVHDQIFVSSPTANVVTVLNFSGAVLSTLSGINNAGSMTVYAGSLYVATTDGIDVFSTSTLAMTGSLATGNLVDPGPLVEAAGKLWTSTGACYGHSTELASVDPSTGQTTVWPVPSTGGLYYCIGLASSPYNTNLLLAWDAGLSPATITEFDVSSGSPTVVASGGPVDLETLSQLAFNPDGTTFVAAAAAPSSFDEFKLSDLSFDGTSYQPSGYPGYPNSVAATQARGGMIVGSAYGTYSYAYAYLEGTSSAAIATQEQSTPYPRGLAVSPDGSKLFDVVQSNAGTTDLLVLSLAGTTTVSISGPQQIQPNGSGTFIATVSGTALPPAPTGSLTFQDNGTTVATLPVSNGQASWSNSWPTGGSHTISVTYSGDTYNTAGTGSTVVTVGYPTTTSLTASPNPATSGQSIMLTASVTGGAPLTGSVTFFEAQATSNTAVGTVAVTGGQAALSITAPTPGAYSLYAAYSGDINNLRGTSNAIAEQVNPRPPVASLDNPSVAFGDQRVGTFGDTAVVTITNTGGSALTVTDISLQGGAYLDFLGATTCSAPIDPGSSCQIGIVFWPTEIGPRSTALIVHDDASGGTQSVQLSGTGTEGYYISQASGQVRALGDAISFGDASNQHLSAPIIASASTTDGDGYWLLGGDGGVFTFGDANFYGSTGAIRLNKPVVALARTPDSGGYWLVASDGGVFSFGDASFYGSTGAIRLNRPIVGMASTPDGRGYWLVASDGGVFTFGNAPYLGSIGVSATTNVVGLAPTSPPLDPYRADHVSAASVHGNAIRFVKSVSSPFLPLDRSR